MNEKRKIELSLDPDSSDTRSRSDVAPKMKEESGKAPARHISGLRPAIHDSDVPLVPPPPLTPEDLLEEGWDDVEEDNDSTLLDSHVSELVAQARAVSDPIAEAEPQTREVATREVPTRAFSRDEATTGEMPTVMNPLPSREEEEEDDEDEFSHDDFPTRQTPMGLQAALRVSALPTDSHRGLHEMLPASDESTPDMPSAPSVPSLVSAVLPPLPPPPTSADETAQMANAPALRRLDALTWPPPPADSSSISQISQVSQVSHVTQTPRGLMYPTPTSINGAPLPPANTVRFAFLRNLSPNNDPPLTRLVVVAAIAFFATLALSAFVAWVIVLVRH